MVLLVVVMAVVAAMFACARWAWWLGGRYGAPRWVRALHWVFAIEGFAQIAIHFWALRKLNGVVDRNEPIDPASKATLIAEGISSAMNGIAFGILFAIASAVVMLVLTWRYHWSARVPKPVGQPPYR